MSEAASGQGEAPLLSVVCLTYNHAAYVAQALEGFLAQRTRFAFEVVIGDDASSDATLSVVESFRPRLGERLRVLSSPVNLGVTRNCRRSFLACRGRYIAFCEGDDHWRGTDKLQRQVDFLEASPAHSLVFHDASVFDASGEIQPSQLTPELLCDASADELLLTRPISTLTACFRNVLGSLPAEFDQAPALDLCLWSLLGLHGGAKFMEDIAPAAYRVHDGGVFSSQSYQNRLLMTAQTYLCLARYHARTGREALSRQLVTKAGAVLVEHADHNQRLQLAGLCLRTIARNWVLAGRRGLKGRPA